MKRIETPQMTLVSYLLKEKTGRDLKTYLMERRGETITLRDGTEIKAGLDDLAYWIRHATEERGPNGEIIREGERVVRESISNWIKRYDLPEPEHDYGVDPDSMPDGSEPEPASA